MTNPYGSGYLPYTQPVIGSYQQPQAGFSQVTGATYPGFTGPYYSQSASRPFVYSLPVNTNPSNTTPSLTMTSDSKKKQWWALGGVMGLTGLATLLAILQHKCPKLLKFWKRQGPESLSKIETKVEEPAFVNPMKPLTFYNDKEAILQRHRLSVEIINELWPDILKYADHKPPGWEKALETRYNEILRKKLNLPERAKVHFTPGTDPSSWRSVCASDFPILQEQLKKTDDRVLIGAVSFIRDITHFDPTCIQAQQNAFTTLTHETNHLLRTFANNEAQKKAVIELDTGVLARQSYAGKSDAEQHDLRKYFDASHPLGSYGVGPSFLRELLEKEQASNPTSKLPILNKELWSGGRFTELSQAQKEHYWKFLKQEWEKPGCEPVKTTYKKVLDQGFQNHTPEHVKTGVEMDYLDELESYALSMYRAPGIPTQVMARDIEDHAKAFHIRQLIKAYYERFKVPPAEQSDLVKDWELKLIPNPLK